MAYIGSKPVTEFSTIPSKDVFTGDGSTTVFDMAREVATGGENALEVFINNVRQEPGSGKAFTLGPDGSNLTKRITFTAAPANGAYIYVINDKTNYLTLLNPKDLNGVELVLDTDGDTSITADTDDQIDIKIANTDHLQILSSSGDTVLKPMVDAKDIIFKQFDGNILLTIDDGNFVSIGGNDAAPGEIRIYEDTDLGTNYSGFKVGNLTASVAYVLPLEDGTSGFQLTTDGSGTLSWAAAGATIANNTNNRLLTATGNLSINGEANLTFDGSTLAVTGATTVSGALTGSSTVQGTTITATTAFVPDASDGAALGTTALEFSDLFLADAAVIALGDDQDVTLTHVADTGILLNSTNVIQFNDASQNIGAPTNAILDINATDEIELNATLVDVNANLDVSGTIVGASTISGTTITATTAFVPDASDGAALGTTALEFSDLFLADAAVIALGDDQDVTLTHVADTGLLINTTMVIQFRDSAINIGSPADGDLDINADDEIELNSTLIDINGNVEISGTAVTTGVHTFTAVPVFPNNTIETADIQADAIDGTKIADNAINSEHYTDGSIDTAHIAADQITSAKIADDQIDSEHYVDGSIDTAHIAADQITNAKIADDQIDSEHYVDGSIDTAHIADNQITLAKLAGGTDGNIISYDASGDPVAIATGSDGQVLTSTGAGSAPAFEALPAGGTSWQAVKTGNYTASAGEGVFANTTSSAFTVTLPASPSIGDEVSIKDYAGTFDTNNLTVGRNSQPIEGVAADLTVSVERAGLTLAYSDSTQGWLLKDK